MKVAVYGICKNEEQHVAQWLSCAEEGDRIFVLDSGSEDQTKELLAAHPKVELHTANFVPFRFDIARNMIANQIPGDFDIAVWLDFDETLEPGWRKKLEAVQAPYDALMFRMIFSRAVDGSPDVIYNRLMAHRPHAYVWVYPIHEVLVPQNKDQDTVLITDITVEHKPDTTKPRSNYLDLLVDAVDEFSLDPRMRQYLGREYMYQGEWARAIIHLEQHVTMQDSPVCISESYRYMSRCYENMGHLQESEQMLMRSIAACPNQREPHGELSGFYQRQGDIESCLAFALSCSRIPESSNYVIRERRYYREWPHHMAAWAYSQLGAAELAKSQISKALNLAPKNPQVIADYINLVGVFPETLLQQINSGELSVTSYESTSSGNQPETVSGADSIETKEVPETVSAVESPVSP